MIQSNDFDPIRDYFIHNKDKKDFMKGVYEFGKILKTSFHKFLVLFLSKNSKNGTIRIYKKPEIILVRQMQFLQYKALNSKFNCNFLSFGL